MMERRGQHDFAFVFVLLTCALNVNQIYGQCEDKDADVLILGAGLAGLGAAHTLSGNGIDNFLIIEQDNEIGGRVMSRKFGGGTVELGAQWLVYADPTLPPENQHPLLRFANQCNVTYRPETWGSSGMRVYTRNGVDVTNSPDFVRAFQQAFTAIDPAVTAPILEGLEEDIPYSNGLRAAGFFPITPVEEWAEFFLVDFAGFAESADHQSYKFNVDPAVNQRRMFSFGSRSLYVVTDDVGYVGIAQCIANDFLTPNDPRLILETAVQSIEWSSQCVCVTANQNGGERKYCGTYAISTIPLGVIQNRGVTFVPDLPLDVYLAIHKMSMGRFMKIYALFNETFWDTDVDFFGHIDEINGRSYYPMFSPWGSFFPSGSEFNVIQAYLYGDIAKRVSYQDEEITRQQIGEVLRNIYGEKASDPLEIMVSPFTSDPYYLGNLGGIPTPGMTNETFRFLNRPIGNLYFAGDFVAYHFHSTAHGAFISGVDRGNTIANLMQRPPQISFINDSPRLEGNNISAEFVVSKPVEQVDCILGGMRQDCSSGQMVFTDLQEGTHRLKIIARNNDRFDRGVAIRSVYISNTPHCAVHLVNGGISFFDSIVSIEFTSTGLPVSGFSCDVDNVNVFPCESPLDLSDLSTGEHRVRISPMCTGQQRRRIFTFSVE